MLMILLSFSLSAQKDGIISHMEHIQIHLSKEQVSSYKRPYIYKDEPSMIKKINPVNLFFGGSLYFYQNVLSKHISADCLYMPSCSEYSKQAIRKSGLFHGVILTIDRLNRCNIISAQDLKHYHKNEMTNRYPDPVSRHLKEYRHNGE